MPALESSEIASKARLLVVDAELGTRTRTAEHLRWKGYQVTEVGSGPEAVASLEDSLYDLMVLELDVPGMAGVEVMRRSRRMHRDLPIVILTAHATLESAIAAVKVGVVDYLIKPCDMEDLALVISRALEESAQRSRHKRLLSMVGEAIEALRQPETPAVFTSLPMAPAPPASAGLRLGSLELDRQKRVVTILSSPPRAVELTKGEVSILSILMDKPEQVFTCSELAKHALGYEGMDKWTVESVIRSAIFRLRQKIEAGPDAPHVIHTVRGRGYYFSPA